MRTTQYSLATILAALCLRVVSRVLPGFADAFSDTFNPLAVSTLGRLSGLLPFSLAEVLFCMLVLYLLFLFGSFLRIFLRGGREKKTLLKALCLRHGRKLLGISALLLMLFELNEDVYFSRTRFAIRYGLERDSYSNEELAEVCRIMVDRINELAPQVERNEDGIMQISERLPDRIREAMGELGKEYPELAGFYPRPKPVLFSKMLSRCDITGIYSMFTVEANYNRDVPPYNLPFTMGHELSHLKGFESEKEANFLGYLCCSSYEGEESADLRYSGAMLGWIYCGNELHRRDREAWKECADAICDSAAKDLEDNNLYWDRYKGKAAETMHEVNDAYLKAEGLSEGFASYNLVTDMIVTSELQKKH